MYTPKYETLPKFKTTKVKDRPFKYVAEVVSRYRVNKGLSQRELAESEDLGSAQLFSNIERGLQSLKPSRIYNFCRVTGCPKETIIEAILSDKRVFLEKEYERSEREFSEGQNQ